MASIGEIVSTLQEASDDIEEAISAANAAESTTEALIAIQAAAQFPDKVAALTAVKESIDELRTYLQGGTDLVDKVINQAQAAAGG
ncbi:hypothetical protein AB0M02_36465 [Actinoplanes sp. NPDC051861]|uniref:hypothetical protein n=1 Tax=Actinoplanes sp. NPDC051861 TaxID=3155170 RepID=UPI0034448AE5